MAKHYIPNSKADARYRRKAFERNKNKIDSEERLLKKSKKDLHEAAKCSTENEKDCILVHGAMKYACASCGAAWWVFLEKGIEEFGEDHKPTPFIIGCPICEGYARDVSGIVKFPEGGYRELPEGKAYFANMDGRDCGVLKFHRRGENGKE